MKAAIVHDFNRPLTIEDVPMPEAGPEQVLVRIEASGLCHTDIHAARGEWPVKPALPFIPGHEGLPASRPQNGATSRREGCGDSAVPHASTARTTRRPAGRSRCG